jgi:hypothetical protein
VASRTLEGRVAAGIAFRSCNYLIISGLGHKRPVSDGAELS